MPVDLERIYGKNIGLQTSTAACWLHPSLASPAKRAVHILLNFTESFEI